MSTKMKAEVLGCRLDAINMEQALESIREAVDHRVPSQVVTLNAEMIYEAQTSPDLKTIYEQALLVTPDGIGSVWALRRQGWPVRERVTGIGLTERLLTEAEQNGWRVFLLGAQPGVTDRLVDKWRSERPLLKVAGHYHGYFSDAEVPGLVAAIQAAGADLLLVALGAPKQERWIFQNLAALQVPVSIGVGGTFDVLVGHVKRAPRFWQRCGLEWLYRLLTEPRRLTRQLALPKFAILVLKRGRTTPTTDSSS